MKSTNLQTNSQDNETKEIVHQANFRINYDNVELVKTLIKSELGRILNMGLIFDDSIVVPDHGYFIRLDYYGSGNYTASVNCMIIHNFFDTGEFQVTKDTTVTFQVNDKDLLGSYKPSIRISFQVTNKSKDDSKIETADVRLTGYHQDQVIRVDVESNSKQDQELVDMLKSDDEEIVALAAGVLLEKYNQEETSP